MVRWLTAPVSSSPTLTPLSVLPYVEREHEVGALLGGVFDGLPDPVANDVDAQLLAREQ